MKDSTRKHPILHKLLCLILPERCPCCDNIIESYRLFCEDCEKTLGDVKYIKPAKGGYPCISCVPYKDDFARGIKRFKFNNRKQYAYSFAKLMADAVSDQYKDVKFDYIAYVPMHKIKQKQRGYNQSKLLAKKLSSILDIPVKNALVKIRNNQPQHTIQSAKKRAENVKGVYKVASKELVKNKSILLVDDIITTGNTLGECAKVLDRCKPLSIHCVTFALSVVKTT